MLENEKKMDGLIKEYANFCRDTFQIDPELYSKYEVKRGLRDISGKGVLAGLTDISEIRSYTIVDSEIVPCDGKLFYQGIDIEDIVHGFIKEDRLGFEETVYLLLFGHLPKRGQLIDFQELLSSFSQDAYKAPETLFQARPLRKRFLIIPLPFPRQSAARGLLLSYLSFRHKRP